MWNINNTAEKYDKLAFDKAKRLGLQIERKAKENCAVDTGRLRASISTAWTGHTTTDSDKVQAPATEKTVVVGTNVRYATYVEFGTKRMPARPFLRKAFDEVILGNK